MATHLRRFGSRTKDRDVAGPHIELPSSDAGQVSATDPLASDQPRISFLTRLREVYGLLAGLRKSDFQAAKKFVALNYGNMPFVARWSRFARWGARQVFIQIPEALQCLSIRGRISKTPVWLADENPLANYPWAHDPAAALPHEADTVVIGAGFTGAALAYHWSRRAPSDRRMVVLEMDDPANGSSGRNEGLVVMGRYFAMVRDSLLERFGKVRADLAIGDRMHLAEQFADRYCRAAYRNAELIEETIAREQFDCEYRKSGWVQIREEAEQQSLSESVQAAVGSGYKDWSELAPGEAHRYSGIRVEHKVGYSAGAASWHPAKWVWCLLLRALDTGGVQLFTQTKVTRATWQGNHYLIETNRGSIRAPHMVYATETYTPKLDARLSGVILPVQEQAASGSGGVGSMPLRGIVSGTWFFAGRHGDRVVFGSGGPEVPDERAGQNRPSRFLTKFVAGELLRLLGPYKLSLTHEWSGTTGYTPDGYPVVGLLDGQGQYIIGGMSGSGSSVSFNAGRCIVNRILGRTDETDDYPAEYFAPARLIAPSEHRWPNIERDPQSDGRSETSHQPTKAVVR